MKKYEPHDIAEWLLGTPRTYDEPSQATLVCWHVEDLLIELFYRLLSLL